MSKNETLGFIGGGNMASAICGAMINKGVFPPSKIWISGPHIEKLSHWKELGVNVTNKNGEVVGNCDTIFLCIKPHILRNAIDDTFKTIKPNTTIDGKLFISILVGITLETLKKELEAFSNCRIIRTMPNLPMLLGMGVTVYTPDDSSLPEDIQLIEKILCSTGICERVPESMIGAVGGLSGSGPAFVYLMIEAMADGGVKQGIPRAMATKFAAQTVMGAGKMVMETGKHPGQLKDEVCSPGGSTICGVHELEKGSVRASYMRAIEAAVERSLVIGSQNK